MVRYQKGASRVAFVPPERTLAKTARARAHPNRHATFLAPSLCLAAPFFRIGLLWEKDHRRACQQEKKKKNQHIFLGHREKQNSHQNKGPCRVQRANGPCRRLQLLGS